VAYAKSVGPSISTSLTKTSANPKAQPKSATSTKATNEASKKAANKAKKRGKNATRSKPKTAEELDADMTDYFTSNGGTATMTDANGTTNGNAQPAAAGGEDLGMDEISVSSSVEFIT
jgi:THO complex subunit 4